MLKQRHQLMVTLFAVSDAATIALVSVGAWALRQARFDEAAPAGAVDLLERSLVPLTVPIALLALWALGQYRPRRDKSVLGEVGQVAQASVLTVMMLIVGLWVVGNEGVQATLTDNGQGPFATMLADPARSQFATLAIGLPLALGGQRLGLRLGLRFLRGRGWNQRHVAIVGDGRLGQIAAHTLARNSWTGLRVAYFVSHHAEARKVEVSERPVRGGLDQLDTVLDEHPVDAVYLALPNAQAHLVPGLLRRLDRFAVDVRLIPDVQPRYVPQSMAIHELEGMPILSYRESPTLGLGGAGKRSLDLVVGALALVVFLPLMVAIALAIRVVDGGPALFRQQRVSLGGDRFRMYKFRTMRRDEGEPNGPAWTDRDDVRITPLGRWLRRTSLDELPQLFNVLRGEMSLVGPRPERPELIERFREDWRGYMLRQHVKAGMTGWAQVHGLRGQSSLRKRLQYDLHYVRHWSIGFDLRILALTAIRGFVHPNAR